MIWASQYQLTEACVFKRLPSVKFSCTSYEVKAPSQNLFSVNAISFHQKSSQIEKVWQRTQISRAQVHKYKRNKTHWTTLLFPLQLLLYLWILSFYKVDKSRGKQNKTKPNQKTAHHQQSLRVPSEDLYNVSCFMPWLEVTALMVHYTLICFGILSPQLMCACTHTPPGSSQLILAIQQYVDRFL